jgi:hypothetical protein
MLAAAMASHPISVIHAGTISFTAATFSAIICECSRIIADSEWIATAAFTTSG